MQYIVHCTPYSYTVHSTLQITQCTPYIVHNVHCTVNPNKYSKSSVCLSVHSVMFFIHFLHLTKNALDVKKIDEF